MSRVLAMQGLRGGCGATSVAAALGWALHADEQRVLWLDLSPGNMLGLHVGLAVDERRGWARAWLDGDDWQAQGYAVEEGLDLLPYGQLAMAEVTQLEQDLAAQAACWPARLATLAADYDWVLADLPAGLPAHAGSLGDDDDTLRLTVVQADPACHVLLQRAPREGLLLVNRYDAAQTLQRDLLQVWHRQFGARLLPQCVHADAAVAEAMAMKQPLGRHAPGSAAAGDAVALALWCMAQAARRSMEVTP